jgi:hypothetical protein
MSKTRMHIAHSTTGILTVEAVAKLAGLKRRQVANLARKGGVIPDVERAPNGYHFVYHDTPRLRYWAREQRMRAQSRQERSYYRARRGPGKKRMPITRAEVKSAGWTPAHQKVIDRKRPRLNATEKSMWRDIAIRDALFPYELDESIRLGVSTRMEQDAPPAAGGGVATFQALRRQWDILRREIEKTLPTWTAEEARRVREMIAPIEAFDRELDRRFPDLQTRTQSNQHEVVG